VSKKTRQASSTAVLSTLSLLVGASAQASHWPVGNDPAGNGTVPAWTGQYIVTIDDSCFESTGTFVPVDIEACTCTFASVYSGTVDLYGLTGPPTGLVQDSFSLVNGEFPSGTWQISEVYINSDGTLGGVDTGLMGGYSTTGIYNDDIFFLQFTIEGDPVTNAFLSTGDSTSSGGLVFGPQCNEQDLVHCQVTIPEPGSLGLLFAALGGLGGGWLTRRRARKSAEA